MYYWAIVHKDKESAYGVSFADIEGCFAASDTDEGLMQAAIEAVDLYLEDVEEVPKPKALSEVREAYREDLLQGAYLIQVPLIERDTQTTRVNLSLERGILRAIDGAAARVNLNRSAFVAMAAKRMIEEKEIA